MNIIIAEIDGRIADDYLFPTTSSDSIFSAKTIGEIVYHLIHNKIHLIVTSLNIEYLKGLDVALGPLLNKSNCELEVWIIRDNLDDSASETNGFKMDHRILVRDKVREALNQKRTAVTVPS